MPSDAIAQGGKSLRQVKGGFLIACILAVAAFFGGFFPLEHNYLWDEAVYLAEAENLFVADPYYAEFSFRPPLFPILLYAGSHWVPLELMAHLLSATFFAAGVFFLFLLGHSLYGYQAGIIAAGLMSISPFFLHWAHKIMTDIPSTTLAILSLYLLYSHVEEENAKPASVFFSGLILALSVMMRFVLILTGICALYLFLIRRLQLRSALWYGAGLLAGLAPYLVWAQVRHGSFIAPFLEAMAIVGGSEPITDKLYYLKATYIVAGPVTLLGLLCYLNNLIKHHPEHRISRDVPLILWYGAFLLYLTSNIHKEIRYVMPAVAPLFVLAGYGLSSIKGMGPRLVVAVLAIVTALYPLGNLRHFDGRMNLGEEILLERSAETCEAAFYLRDRMSSEQVIYSGSLYPLLGYCSKKKTVPLWPWDYSFYSAYPENMKWDGYLTVYKDVAKEPRQEWLEERTEFLKIREFDHIIIYKYTYPRPTPY